MNTKAPYGYRDDGNPYCVNVELGTFNHECGKPASWVSTAANRHRSCFCDGCKERGWERTGMVSFERIAGAA